MSRRNYFAAAALTGLLAGAYDCAENSSTTSAAAFATADAMLAESERGEGSCGLTVTLTEPQSDDQIRFANNDSPNEILELGKPYEVAEIEIHSWHTKLHLKVFPGKKFNSINFEYSDGGAARDEALKAWREKRGWKP